MRTPIAGAVVLSTGGASGIGREMAIGAANRGATQVIIWDIDVDGAEELPARLGSMTHATSEDNLGKVVAELREADFVCSPVRVMRVEGF